MGARVFAKMTLAQEHLRQGLSAAEASRQSGYQRECDLEIRRLPIHHREA